MPQRIALVHNLNHGDSEHEVEFDSPITIDALTESIGRSYECQPIEAGENIQWINELTTSNIDLVFNVAEGFQGAGREAFYPALYEQLGLKYTGPGPSELLITHNKALTKQLLKPHGITMAWSRLIGSMADLEYLKAEVIPFPVIVKLNSEGSSKGMDEHCICTSVSALEHQVGKLLKNYDSNVIIEKYIPGRDMSMTYVQGLGVFGPAEYVYPDKKDIYDQKLKGDDNHKVEVHQKVSLELEKKRELKALTEKIASILDIQGYCRVDYRLDDRNNIYVLEVNGQVSFHPDGAFVKATYETGHNYDTIVHHIIRHALNTRRRVSKIGVIR